MFSNDEWGCYYAQPSILIICQLEVAIPTLPFPHCHSHSLLDKGVRELCLIHFRQSQFSFQTASAVYCYCYSLWGSHIIHYAQKLQNWLALRNRQEEILRVAHNFNCHCPLLDEHLSAASKWALSNHSAKNTAIFMLLFLCTAHELFIFLLAWLS